jgi:2-C-methyl-D-erythritol 4-phosphate cytidylyltransferase
MREKTIQMRAIIVAGGSSTRMGFNKLLAPLGGETVLWHSVRAFAGCSEVSEVVLVARLENLAELGAAAASAAGPKPLSVVPGGAERHLSVWEGLRAETGLGWEWVAIHDAARPLVTDEAIRDCLKAAQIEGAACCAAPIPDTVKRTTSDGVVSESVDRTGLWAMQTPQIFSRKLICRAYSEVLEKNETVSDEVSAVQRVGGAVRVSGNADWNFKITFPGDVERAEQVLRLRRTLQSGGAL